MVARNTIVVIVCALMVLVVFRGLTFAQEKEIDHKEKRTERREGEREDARERVDRRDRDVRHDIVIKRHPPVERREIRGRAPSSRHVWIPGRWVWQGRWVWLPGVWQIPPGVQVVWVPGHWLQVTGGWTWVDGHWGDGSD